MEIKDTLITPPSIIGFIVTNKCTAACKDCCFGCNPNKKDRLYLDEMKHYINQALDAYSTIKTLVLTGGECFTIGRDLDRIIQYGAEKGLVVRVVTNGYWAKSFKKAYIRLKKLQSLGLNEINISTGDEHLNWVSYDNIVYAIAASLNLNLTTVVNIETNHLSKFNSENLKGDPRLKRYIEKYKNAKLRIINGVWMPFTKSTERKINYANLEKGKTISIYTASRCTNLFNIITITPSHHVNACCGLTSEYIPVLKLGNVKRYSIKQLYEYQFEDFLKIWLYTEGPQKIMEFVFSCDSTKIIDTSGWHNCQICAELLRDEDKIKIIQRNYHKIFSSIMLKYAFQQKYQLNNIKTIDYEKEN
jgi:MoaA/NifB/PqqE/SkfB family radical SAM enzyme